MRKNGEVKPDHVSFVVTSPEGGRPPVDTQALSLAIDRLRGRAGGDLSVVAAEEPEQPATPGGGLA